MYPDRWSHELLEHGYEPDAWSQLKHCQMASKAEIQRGNEHPSCPTLEEFHTGGQHQGIMRPRLDNGTSYLTKCLSATVHWRNPTPVTVIDSLCQYLVGRACEQKEKGKRYVPQRKNHPTKLACRTCLGLMQQNNKPRPCCHSHPPREARLQNLQCPPKRSKNSTNQNKQRTQTTDFLYYSNIAAKLVATLHPPAGSIRSNSRRARAMYDIGSSESWPVGTK